MSQISILGFTPAQMVPSPEAANSIHWSFLLSPASSSADSAQQQNPTSVRPRARSFFSSQRRLSRQESNTSDSSSADPTLFDIHNHQLRQQQYPVSRDPSDLAEFSPLTSSISSDIPNKPFTLSLRIVLSTHHPLPVSKLSRRFSSILYHTPTYGPEEDWLRAALDALVTLQILEPATSFDADLILAFAGESVKEYLAHIEHNQHSEQKVLELDYAKHVHEMAAVRAMFTHSPAVTPPRTTTPTTLRGNARPQVTRNASSRINYFNRKDRKNSTDVLIKTHKFLGFTISPSPSSVHSPRQRWNAGGVSGGEKRNYYERQDDPYGGLM